MPPRQISQCHLVLWIPSPQMSRPIRRTSPVLWQPRPGGTCGALDRAFHHEVIITAHHFSYKERKLWLCVQACGRDDSSWIWGRGATAAEGEGHPLPDLHQGRGGPCGRGQGEISGPESLGGRYCGVQCYNLSRLLWGLDFSSVFWLIYPCGSQWQVG